MPNCPTCNGITKAGTVCRLKTCKFAPKCYHHTPIKIGPSQIPNAGRGMFSRRDIRKGEIISNYTLGTKKMTLDQFKRAYPSGRATHVWSADGRTFYDARDANKSVAGMANRAPKGKRNNARITGSGSIIATARIPADREILVSYGSGYRI